MMNRLRTGHGLFVACAAVALLGGLAFTGCQNIPRGSADKNDLSAMMTGSVEIVGRTTYTVYIADKTETITLGLMNVTEDELPADRGMLFEFPRDSHLSFWMRNTIIPLDIAFIRSDGTIVKTYTMTPLDESGYPSIEPARYALEVRGGQFAEWGVVEGDRVEISRDIAPGGKIKNTLKSMNTVPIKIKGRTTYTAYVADNPGTRQLGLMNQTEDDLAADCGMIFAFDSDQPRGFWMRNTVIPLDIAYINSDGLIVKTHTMRALDESSYPSIQPAQYVLEVRAGQFKQWGIVAGDRVEIPTSLLNPPS